MQLDFPNSDVPEISDAREDIYTLEDGEPIDAPG